MTATLKHTADFNTSNKLLRVRGLFFPAVFNPSLAQLYYQIWTAEGACVNKIASYSYDLRRMSKV